jgi:hypothetical protein
MWSESSVKLRVAAAGLVWMRYTPPGRPNRRRAISRSWRRSRFRTAALPTRLLMANTSTARCGGRPGSQEIVMGPDRAVLALRSRSKVERPGVFHVKLPGGAGPSGGAL